MTTIATQAIDTGYTALSQGAAIQVRSSSGLLVLSDADRADFLQRMTTNDINRLRPGQSAVTVLTSPTARILFVFTVLCRTEELWLLPAPGEAAALARHLRGQIFFMDKVKVRDASAEWSQARLMGPQAEAALATLGFDLPAGAEGAWQEREGLLALRQERYDLPGFVLLTPVDWLEAAIESLVHAGATPLANEETYHVRRVELGRPAPGHELTGDYTPLEAGLAWACAENKGCYTGQEIIARQITYDKVTRNLVGLRAAEPLEPGATVQAGGQTAGVVTSAAYSSTLGTPVALAILKRQHTALGLEVTVDGVTAEVVALPFVE
ncbi:MAG: glycine cleavage system protein T [Chloroflexi bacterium]|nr:MAG: glycine cleavage system protein T [Chloroflexota bacterium]